MCSSDLDALEPFALIALQAAIENKLDLIPDFVYGAGFISGDYLLPDGTSKSIYDEVLYQLTRDEQSSWLSK